MPGAVATATTANTSATPPIPSRVGQNCRILDAAVTLLDLAFESSNSRPSLLPNSPSSGPGHAGSTETIQPRVLIRHSPDSGGFEAKGRASDRLGHHKSRAAGVNGDRSRRLAAPKRRSALLCSHQDIPLSSALPPLSPRPHAG